MILRNGVQICYAKLENVLDVLHPLESQNHHTEMFTVAKQNSQTILKYIYSILDLVILF